MYEAEATHMRHAETPGGRAGTDPGRRAVLRVLPSLMLAMLLGALDQTIMAPALPTVAGGLGGLDRMSDLVTAYLVAATVSMPLYGKFGDRFGRKRVLQVAIVLFLIGAALCATAESFTALTFYRALQGLGGGGLMIGPQAIIGEIVSPRERGRYLGLIGGAYVVAAVAGPVVGGFFIDRLSWRWIFYTYLPLGLLALVALSVMLRLPRPERGPRIDYAGALCLAAAVIGLILLTSGVSGDRTWGTVAALAALTIAGCAGWLLAARFAADPIIPLRLFRDPSFAIPAAISFLIGFAMLATVSYTPSLLQIAMGASASESGLVVMTLMTGILTATTVSGRLITRTGRYKAYPVAGTVLATAGMGLLASVDAASGPFPVGVAILLLGLGIGLVMQVMVLAAQNSADHRDLGAATGTVTFLRQIGATAGVAVVGSLVTARFLQALPGSGQDANSLTPELLATLPPADRTAVAGAFGEVVPQVFGYVTPLLVLACALALALPARPLRDTAHVTMPETSRSKS
ncbi:MFS transporter [Streptosporangium soli]|nr:MFS transporter [Streptosporangium sp. KLBMP 9127]